MKGMTLISFSMPKDLSSLSNQAVVPVLGRFHGSHAVSMGTVQDLFGKIRDLTATWGDLQFGPRETWQLFNKHPALIAFLCESSLGGINPFTGYFLVFYHVGVHLIHQNPEIRMPFPSVPL
jgi:hypothetical protein